jgi:hypothetical protein
MDPCQKGAMRSWDTKSEKRMNPHKFLLTSHVCGFEA